MPAGRPSKYNKSILQQARWYLSDGYKEQGDVVPSVVGLAGLLDVTEKTCYNWGGVHPDFLHTLEQINAKQKRVLINKGLSNDFNSNIVKLMLGNHGYSDKTESTLQGPGGTPIENKIIVEFVRPDETTATE